MALLSIILVICALLCFLAGTIQVQPPQRPVNWTSLGFVFLVIVYLIAKGA